MADQYYIDDDYYTPDGYFVYTADAAASVASISTLTTPGESTKTFSCSISATSSVTAVGEETSELVLSAFGQCVLTCDAVKTTDIDETLNSITTTTVAERRLRSTSLSIASVHILTPSYTRIREATRNVSTLILDNISDPLSTTGKFSNAWYVPNAGGDGNVDYEINFFSSNRVGGGSAGTLEFWFYPQTNADGYVMTNGIFNETPPTPPGSFNMYVDSGDGQTFFHTASATSIFSANLSVNLGQFNHITLQTDGNDNWYVWINGVYKDSGTNNQSFALINFGRSDVNSPHSHAFDEVRVSSIERYVPNQNFTPATQPFNNDTDTLALFHCDTTTQRDDFIVEWLNARATTTLSADGLRVKNLAASIASTTTLTASALKIVDGAANLQSTSTITAVGGYRQQFTSSISATSQCSVTGNATFSQSSSVSGTTNLTCLGVTNKDIVLSAFGDAQVTATATVTRGLTASLQATSSAVTTANQTAAIACVIQSTSSVTANVNRTASLSANFTTLANIVAINEGFEGGEATLLSTTNLTSAPVKTARITQSLQSTSQIAVDLRRTVRFICVMQGQGFQLSEGEVLTSDPDLTFRVLPENRTWAIDQETGIIQVLSENRINTVEQETGEYQVLPETRILA